MANNTLTSYIRINGAIDPSASAISKFFSGLGSQLQSLGGVANQLTAQFTAMARESMQMYADFEDKMLYIKSLSGMTADEMETIAAKAREVGATTRYTATQAAGAMEYNAIAGKGYADNLALIDKEARMAAAGNMELERAADQLLTALTVTGTQVNDADVLIDRMAKTAASSKTDLEGLGDALARFGATSQYVHAMQGDEDPFGNITAAMTMLGELGNMGLQGTEIGTYARNIVLALAAPSKKAGSLMEELEVTQDEYEELMDGIDVGAASELMKSIGLDVIDEQTGKMRNVFEILNDLYYALPSDDTRIQALQTIFNKRTVAYAEQLMKVAASGEWRDLYATVADSEEFAAKVAAERESGLGGAMRLMNSQMEELKLTLGEILSSDAIGAMDIFGEFFGWITNLPQEQITGLVQFLETMAGLGAGLMITGGALKTLGLVLSPKGLLIVGMAALIQYMRDLHAEADKQFALNFGEAEIDIEALTGKLNALSDAFNAGLNESRELSAEATAAYTEYEKYEGLIKDGLKPYIDTGDMLSDEDYDAIYQYGVNMREKLIEGMRYSSAASLSFWNEVIGSSDDENAQNDLLSILGITDEALNFDTAKVESAGARFNAALLRATKEGFTQEVIDEINAAMAEVDAVLEERRRNEEKIQQTQQFNNALYYAQSDIEKAVGLMGDIYTSTVNGAREQGGYEAAKLQVNAENVIAEYEKRRDSYVTDSPRWQAFQNKIDERRAFLQGFNPNEYVDEYIQNRLQETGFDSQISAMMDSYMANTGLADEWTALNRYRQEYLASGMGSFEDFAQSSAGWDAMTRLQQAIPDWAQFQRLMELVEPAMAAMADSSLEGTELYSAMLTGGWGWLRKGFAPGSAFERAYAARGIQNMQIGLASDIINAAPGIFEGVISAGQGARDFGQSFVDTLASTITEQPAYMSAIADSIQGYINWFMGGDAHAAGTGSTGASGAGRRSFRAAAMPWNDTPSAQANREAFLNELDNYGREAEQERKIIGSVFSTGGRPFRESMMSQWDETPAEMIYARRRQAELDAIEAAAQERRDEQRAEERLKRLQAGVNYRRQEADNTRWEPIQSKLDADAAAEGFLSIAGMWQNAVSGFVGALETLWAGPGGAAEMPAEAINAEKPAQFAAVCIQDEIINTENPLGPIDAQDSAEGAATTIHDLIADTTFPINDLDPSGGIGNVINDINNALGQQTFTIPIAPQIQGAGNGGGGGLFAEGGRADAPSIFGEAGPEWAIPERHTQKTAELLARAATASGFTWGEIISRTGGLGGSVVVNYAPVTNVQDSRGLEAAQERMQKAFFDRLRRNDIIGARVRYNG